MIDEKKLSEDELNNVTGGKKITYPGFDGKSVPNPSLDPLEDKPDTFDPFSGEGIRAKKPIEDELLGKVTGGYNQNEKEDPEAFKKKQEEAERLRKIAEAEERERVKNEIEEAQRKAAQEYDKIK